MTILILMVLSAVFSASETAFSAARVSKITAEKHAGWQTAAELINNRFEKLLSTILVGNNIVNTVLTAEVTMAFASRGEPTVAVAVAVVTIAVIFFGEITPKTIAKQHAEYFACKVARPMVFVMAVLTPVTFLLERWQRLFASNPTIVTRAEVEAVVSEAADTGGIDDESEFLMKRALAFGDLDVGSALVLTHRRKVPFIHKDADHSRLHQLLQENDYVLLVDKIDGRPSIDAPVASVDRGGGRSHLLFVPAHMKADDLLLRMRRERTELAVVVDEFGGTVGVVTMDDLLAALVAVVN